MNPLHTNQEAPSQENPEFTCFREENTEFTGESWQEYALFSRECVERFVRENMGKWIWCAESECKIWADETRPLEQIEGLGEALTGWADRYGGPGRTFTNPGYARVSRHRVLVSRSGGLDI